MPPCDRAALSHRATVIDQHHARALARIPPACRRGGPGWRAAAACILEATAPKPGNVHPGAAFADLSYADLVAAAVAIGPVLDGAAARPLGLTVRLAVEASRRVTRSNANLGLVLAIAPLAAVPGTAPPDAATVERVLAGLDDSDAADVWAAIRLAAPGGLGTATTHDVHGPPPADLRAAMRLAAPHDLVARLWAEGYAPLCAGLVGDLDAELAAGHSLDDAIVRAYLRQLAREPDSLIIRRHGAAAAADVSLRAAAVIALPEPRWRSAAAELDAFLRAPLRLNPGTTADLVAAALYILLSVPGRLPLPGDP
jgi:triphosphoribosyl-dephospho-CoA synthase